MYCPNCGKEIPSNSKFCKFCGHIVSETSFVEEKPHQEINKKPEKLDGWLIIVFLGLCFASLVTAYGAFSTLSLFNDGTITLLNDSSSPVYSPSLSTAITLELIGEAVFVGGAIYLGYLFFKRSKNFPKFYIWLLIYNVIFLVID